MAEALTRGPIGTGVGDDVEVARQPEIPVMASKPQIARVREQIGADIHPHAPVIAGGPRRGRAGCGRGATPAADSA